MLEVDDIYCMDCIEGLNEINTNSVNLVVTSPPYNVGIEYDNHNDSMEWESYYSWCCEWMSEIYRILKEDGRVCINHCLSFGDGGFRHSPIFEFNRIAGDIGFKHHGLVIWEEKTMSKRSAWGSWLEATAPYINMPYEGILVMYKDSWKRYNHGESTIGKEEFMSSCTGIWKMNPSRSKDTPVNFPKELPMRCINLLTFKGDLVVDPFSGSGTTCEVAKELNRHYIGFDNSEKYVKIAKNKLNQTSIRSYI